MGSRKKPPIPRFSEIVISPHIRRRRRSPSPLPSEIASIKILERPFPPSSPSLRRFPQFEMGAPDALDGTSDRDREQSGDK